MSMFVSDRLIDEVCELKKEIAELQEDRDYYKLISDILLKRLSSESNEKTDT